MSLLMVLYNWAKWWFQAYVLVFHAVFPTRISQNAFEAKIRSLEETRPW
jgi:hypothetical protein